MTVMTGHDQVSLPQFTRHDALEAARLGLSREEYEARMRSRIKTPPRDIGGRSGRRTDRPIPRSGKRMDVTEDEYKTLCLVAGLARRALPFLEQSSFPVTHHSEFEGLREALDTLALHGWGDTAGNGRAVTDLLGILDSTRPE